MDVCVVTYRNSAERVRLALRPHDRLFVHDNSERNVGFAAGANRAARKGAGELIVFANPDGDPHPDCFDHLEAVFSDPAVVAAEASQGTAWDRPRDRETNEVEWLSGGCLAVRRSAFEQVGGFDERLFMYCEDVDLSYKLARLGRLRLCPAAVFEHDDEPRSFSALHRNFRNWLVVQRRHRGARPSRMLRDAAFAARRGRWRDAAARASGVLDYAVRARRWS